MAPSFPHRLPLVHQICLGLFCCFLLSCDVNTNKQAPAEGQEEPIPTYAELVATNAAVRFNMLGDSFLYLCDYPAAIRYYQLSMDSAAVNADSFPYYDSKLDLACVHDRLGELNTAIQIAEPVIEAYIRSEDSARIGRGYSTLAAFYGRAKMPEKFFAAARKGFDILKNHGSAIERCAAYNQMAFTFSDQKRWAEALPLLDTALLLMQASNELDQLPAIYLNLGDCHRNLQNWPQARLYLQQSVALADSLGQIHVRSKAIERLSQVAEIQGDYATAHRLFKQSAALKDSILNKEKVEHLHTLEINYQTKEKEYLINSLRMEQQTAVAQRNLTYALGFLALTVLVFGIFQVRYKLNQTRQSIKKYQQELKAFTELLRSKNTQLLELEKALQKDADKAQIQAGSREETNPDLDPSIEELEGLFSSRILTFEDWENFKHRFEQAYPGYLLRLRTTQPDLSNAEERLFLLIKLGLNSQEIADTLGITGNGVKKGRQRLRKRLNLQADEDLDRTIMSF